jgi:4-carboxymuconolactone decarboxylase
MSKIDYRNTPEYKKGMEIFKSKHPPASLKMIDEMYRLSPELADVVISHGVYDIWDRKTPNLTAQEKEIASLAVLIEQQNPFEVRSHVFTCLKLGITKERILELFVFLTLYSGVPKLVIAYHYAKEAFEEYDCLTKGTR